MAGCHNCGLPPHAQKSRGFNVELKFRAENRMRRDRKGTVWCCTRDCVVQSLALSDMGPAPSKWSNTLKDFSKRVRPERYEELDSKENPSQDTENKGAKTTKTEGMAVPRPRLPSASQNAFNSLSLFAQGYGIDCRGLAAADQEEIAADGLKVWWRKRRSKGGRPMKYHTPEDQRKANAEHQRKFRRKKQVTA